MENNSTIIKRYFEEVLNNREMETIGDFFIPGSMLAGGIKGQMLAMKTAFPDMHMEIEEMVAEGERVAVWVTSQGTHTGPLVGLPAFGKLENPLPPTGRPISITGMMFFKLVDGKIASTATELDQIGLLRQLGWTFIPPDPS